MLVCLNQEEIKLAPGQTISGVLKHSREIRVLQGRVWITIAGVTDDYWLESGASFSLPAHMLIVLEADAGPSRLGWLPAANSANCKPTWRNPLRLLWREWRWS